MYDELIQHTNEELTQWGKANTSFKRNVYRHDIDIALEYFYICNKNVMNKARERSIKRYAEQEGITIEEATEQLKDTASREGLTKYCDYIADKHKTDIIDGRMRKINVGDPKKSTSIIEYLTHMGLLKCLDDKSDKGIARKFKLSEEAKQVREKWNTGRLEEIKVAVA